MYYLLYFYSIPYSEEIFKRTSFSFFIERVNSKAFLPVCAELPDFGLPALLSMSVFLAELPPVVQRSLQGPALHPGSLCRAPALHPATPFEKGVDPKTFSADGQHPFLEKGKNLECRNNGFPGTDLWTPVAVPSVGVLCFRAWWEASSESPWVFGDASRLHDLKRLCLFRRDEVPARNTSDCPALPLQT